MYPLPFRESQAERQGFQMRKFKTAEKKAEGISLPLPFFCLDPGIVPCLDNLFGEGYTKGEDVSIDTVPSANAMMQSLNRYVYCVNNPLKYSDPTGLNPGDKFSTAEDAALDFGFYINETSINDNENNGNDQNYGGCEYASSIYLFFDEDGVPYYTYTEPNRGAYNQSYPYRVPHDTELVAVVHTHGAFVPTVDIEDNVSDNFSIYDIDNANKRIEKYGKNILSYLVNPAGELKVYDPSENLITLISRDLPYDPNHPLYREDGKAQIEAHKERIEQQRQSVVAHVSVKQEYKKIEGARANTKANGQIQMFIEHNYGPDVRSELLEFYTDNKSPFIFVKMKGTNTYLCTYILA